MTDDKREELERELKIAYVDMMMTREKYLERKTKASLQILLDMVDEYAKAKNKLEAYLNKSLVASFLKELKERYG